MFVLSVIPLAWGYLLADRALRESQRWLRWTLAYALGLLSFFIGVNALFYWLPLRWAVHATVALLGLGSVILIYLPGRRPVHVARRLGPIEGPVLAILALTAFFQALFWQMQWSDDDFFIHAPVMALFFRDVFPTQNPYFPHLTFVTHYGRDLTISAVSVLFGEHFLAVQYILTAANQAAAVLVSYFTARRFLQSPAQALWAVVFAFAGINFDGRRGLLETFQNNNSFATLFVFLNVYLFLTALARRSRLLALISGTALGTFAVFYESSFGLLGLTFAFFPMVLCALRWRWRLGYFTGTAIVLVIAGVLALVEGGIVTELAKRHVFRASAGPQFREEERRMSHELKIRIPKPGFTITGPFKGDEYPLWSRRLAEDAGTFVPLLPLTGALMLLRRKPWGILMAGLSALAILIPALIDFGTFNSESLRFLIVGGAGGAMLFGVALGMLWEKARGWGTMPRAIVAVVLAGVASISIWPSARSAYDVLRAAALYPRDHYLVAEEWGCTVVLPHLPCEPIDVSAAIALRPFIRPGDHVLVDFRDDNLATLMSAEATFVTFARTFLSGPGLRIVPEGNPSQMTPLWDAEGFRARVFFATGEVSILDDLDVDYVSLNPANLAPSVYAKIRRDPRLERVVHVEWPGGGAVREAYRVKPAATPEAWTPPRPFRIVSLTKPPEMLARWVYPVTLSLTGDGPGIPRLRLSYEVRLLPGTLANANDEVRLPVTLHRNGSGQWTGTLWLATPYEAGRYEVHLFAWDGSTRSPLRDPSGGPVTFSIDVH